MSLFRKRQRNPAIADLAGDDWAPVPVSLTASPSSWADWLEEEEEEPMSAPRSRRARETSELDSAIKVGAPPPRAPTSDGYLAHLTEEERRIIQAQRAAAVAPTSRATRPARPSSSSARGAGPSSRAVRPQRTSALRMQAAARSPQTRAGSTDVIQSYAAHLTPEELAIIKGQMK